MKKHESKSIKAVRKGGIKATRSKFDSNQGLYGNVRGSQSKPGKGDKRSA